MSKRIPAFLSMLMLCSALGSIAANAGNFSTGALLNREWTCIKPDPKNNGPISDIKVAELTMAPTSAKKKGSLTVLQYTKFELHPSKGTYTRVALGVFNGTKTYKQSFLNLKDTTAEQKINFQVSVPTNQMKSIVLSITIQNPSDKSSTASCIPNKAYQELLPKNSSHSSSSSDSNQGSKSGQIVLASIAKENDYCQLQNEISFGLTAPLECFKGKWKSKSEQSDTVATRAYRYLINRYNSMPDSTPNLLLRIDPQAGKWKNDVASGIAAGARLWGTSKVTDKPIPSYISETGEYVSSQLAADGIQENPEDAKRNRDAAARGGGQAGSHGKYFDFIFSEQSSTGYGFYQVGPHEYTHYAQQILSNNRTGMVEREFWIDEGCATFVGTGLGAVLGLPQNQRADLIENIERQKNGMPLKFFSRGSQSSYADPRINEVYDTGFLACEALVALKGIEAIELVYKELASPAANYDSSLTSVYGVGLDSLIPFLQKYIDSVRSGKPMSLESIQRGYSAIGGK